MIKYLCRCGYEIFDNEEKFEKLPESWKCPKCYKGKSFFMRIEYTKDFSKAPLIKAHYESNKEWRMDPKRCYFTIKPFKEEGVIRVNYYIIKDGKHILKLRIEGKTGEEIYNTIIRERLIGSMQHAAYLGYELAKAELSLKCSLDYEQDECLFNLKNI